MSIVDDLADDRGNIRSRAKQSDDGSCDGDGLYHFISKCAFTSAQTTEIDLLQGTSGLWLIVCPAVR